MNKSKPSPDERLAAKIQKAADKALKRGNIDFLTYRDVSWNVLQMRQPRATVKLTGLHHV